GDERDGWDLTRVSLRNRAITPRPITPELVAPSIMDTSGESQSLAYPQSHHIPVEVTSTHDQQHSGPFQKTTTYQELHTPLVRRSPDEQTINKLYPEMNRSHSPQERVLQIEQQMEADQREMLQLQIQAQSRLAVIQSRVQALAAQTFELHEFPTPRLFLILPKPTKPTGSRDRRTTRHSVDQFRLYFLCECGPHTMTEGCKTPHEIHLAKHEGYDLDKPKEFFDKYGSYILTMLHMIKYGTTAAGTVIPPLATSKIINGVESDHRQGESTNDGIGLLVDDVINFLQNFNDTAVTRDGKAIESTDLRQLESYLKVKDQDRAHGDLFRVVTHDGHVKWVCMDHYRMSHQESTAKQLRDIVQVNGGTFNEHTGNVEVKIASNALAKQFYDAMVKARSVQELAITLQWDATMDELQTLAKAVTNANVTLLTVNGTHLKGPKLDVLNWNRRFDPLLRLASNGRIQSLQLDHFDTFFRRVSTQSSLSMAPKLRVLTIEPEMPFKDPLTKSFLTTILDNCLSLTQLDLRLEPRYLVQSTIKHIINTLNRLELLKLDFKRISTRLNVSDGIIQKAAMRITRLSDLTIDDMEFARKGHLEQLDVEYTPQKEDEGRLTDIWRRNPKITNMSIGCIVERSLEVIGLLSETREKVLQKDGKVAKCTLELKEEKLAILDEKQPFDGMDHISATVCFRVNSSIFAMRTRAIILQHVFIDEGDITTLSKILSWYGHTVEILRMSWAFGNHFAELLDRITSLKGSQFRVIQLNTNDLLEHGLECMGRVIDRSKALETLEMEFYGTRTMGLSMDTNFLTRFGDQLTGLTLRKKEAGPWLSKIASIIPTRRKLPKLESFQLVMDGDMDQSNDKPVRIGGDDTSWIVKILTGAPAAAESSATPTVAPLPEGTSTDILKPEKDATLDGWRSLKKIALKGVNLEAQADWEKVIQAIDFSTLECLVLGEGNFSQSNLESLVDAIKDQSQSTSPLPLQTLDIDRTCTVMDETTRNIIQGAAPGVHILAKRTSPRSSILFK
ncbi:hypothetical protein BGX31_010258, partial [Mortierella sp. GBA43]